MNDANMALDDLRQAAQGDDAAVPVQARPEKPIYLLRHDVLYAHDTALQLGAYGYHTTIADNLQELVGMLGERAPCGVLVDSDDGASLAPGDFDRIRAASMHPVPVLLLSSRDNFAVRLAAARAGVDGYFIKPLDIPALAERLDGLTTFSASDYTRVLIVCNDSERNAFYRGIIAGAGMEALRPNRPAEMLRMLDQHRPDAVLVDVDSPACTAADVIALVRQDSAFSDIPIIVACEASDTASRQNAISLGADDALCRPFLPSELVFSLRTRIERYRSLRGLIMRDGLTGLYNHAAFKEQLLRGMARARRERKPMAFAMLDLDHFKRINDSHGHPVGDQVLRTVARLMRQRLRYDDVVGRYGGEEFGIIMPGTAAAGAANVLNEIRGEFQNICHRGADGTFNASFTAGIVEYDSERDAADAMSLIRRADAALYRGKQAGRNRVEIDGPN